MSVAKKRILVPVEYCANLNEKTISLTSHVCYNCGLNSLIEIESPEQWTNDRTGVIKAMTEMFQECFDSAFEPDRPENIAEWRNEIYTNYRTVEETFHASSTDQDLSLRFCCAEAEPHDLLKDDWVSGVIVLELECPVELSDYLEEKSSSPWLYGLRY